MRVEDIQLAIRPRTLLECLDVTFLFCSRHCLGLLATASMGIVPIACFNWWVADIAGLSIYPMSMLLLLEIPWATIFVTLYLGQTIFSKRLSMRRLLREAVRSIPALLAIQLVVRGACLAVLVLAPVVFLGMYYMNEIILLERPAFTIAWNRRTAMNEGIMGRIVSFRIMDLLIMFGGTYALASLFRAISALWEDQIDSFEWMFADTESAPQIPFTVDWQSHAAFWVIVVFLTVFRFMTYLDCRIRREGWDVELKLRAQTDLHRQKEAAG